MPQYVHIDVWPGGIAVLLLRREPVNLMDLTMWQQLPAALDQLEADEVVHPSPSLPIHVQGIDCVVSYCAVNTCTLRYEQAGLLRMVWACRRCVG